MKHWNIPIICWLTETSTLSVDLLIHSVKGAEVIDSWVIELNSNTSGFSNTSYIPHSGVSIFLLWNHPAGKKAPNIHSSRHDLGDGGPWPPSTVPARSLSPCCPDLHGCSSHPEAAAGSCQCSAIPWDAWSLPSHQCCLLAIPFQEAGAEGWQPSWWIFL